MKHKWLIFLCFLLVAAVIAVIWWHSLQPGAASHAESRRVLAFALSHLQGTRLAPYLSDGHIRRLAHLTEYGTLGLVMSCFSLLQSGRQRKKWVLLAGICIAAIDEYIQQFSGGRTSTWHDVVLDSGGCCVGICVVAVLRFLGRSRSSVKDSL
ncbi:MAG: VanZ family protein [Megasphaera sp.]|uniref:VanZ family protein n=1 Tax=Megasphaera sp. TaxID=2023260 RepID=UPI003F101E5D